ncbi:hypothetical protein ElyMa_006777500 [Elysia marginata]|uniref:Uncharacterized protein n=1 Tax=Elysia marginata TaxID=1093978 RepID=A0AAV4J409_9GAST|nr:hypothetical protein ElyMa_006777500 [Elysia marginata]
MDTCWFQVTLTCNRRYWPAHLDNTELLSSRDNTRSAMSHQVCGGHSTKSTGHGGRDVALTAASVSNDQAAALC